MVPSMMVSTRPPLDIASRISVCLWNLMPLKWAWNSVSSASRCCCTSKGGCQWPMALSGRRPACLRRCGAKPAVSRACRGLRG